MKKSIYTPAFIIMLLFSAHGYAEILATIPVTVSGGHSIVGDLSYLGVSFCVTSLTDVDNPEEGCISWRITPSDIGRTFSESDSTSFPEMIDSFKALLTNGIDDSLRAGDTFLKGAQGEFPGSQYESAFITNGGAVDLQGYIIEELSLTLNDMSIEIDNGPLIPVTNYSYDYVFTISGSPVPEPCTLLLFGFGGFLLRRRFC